MKHHNEFTAGTAAEDDVTYFTALEASAVDSKNGVIKGVSVITSGVTAKGHNLETDSTTLLQMKALADKRGKVPTKWNHRTGADAVNGYLMNFRMEGKKLKADWHLLKSHAQYQHALELAEVMPDGVGLSASFIGKNEKKGGKELARCEELLSVDLVATPAANPDGLFEARVDKAGNGMADNKKPGADKPEDQEVTLAAVLAAVTDLSTRTDERFGAIEQRFSAFEEEEEEIDDDGEDDGEEVDETEFSSLSDIVTYFETRVKEAESDRERHEFETMVTTLEEKVGGLMELNEQLSGENELMARALKELSAASKKTVEFSAGTDGEPKLKIESSDGRKLTEFEARVVELQREEKLDYGAAMLKAQEEDTERYLEHNRAKGAYAQELGR